MKLTGALGNFRTNKVLTVAEFASKKVELVVLKNPKDKEFLAKNPSGKGPVLETSEGVLS